MKEKEISILWQEGNKRVVRIVMFHRTPTSPNCPSFHYIKEQVNDKGEWEQVGLASMEEIQKENK